MKNLFLRAPMTVRSAAIIVVATPIVLSVVGFRLYAHPANPNAWLILGVFGALYAALAAFLLRGSNIVRWLWTIWMGIGVIRLVALYLPNVSEFSEPVMTVIASFTAQSAALVLLFFPASNQHFTGRKAAEPGATDNPGDAQ